MHEEIRKGGPGGGGGDLTSWRIAHLEEGHKALRSDIKEMRGDVQGLRVDFATLSERVAHLPGKGFIVTALGTSIAILSGLAVLAQRMGFFAS